MAERPVGTVRVMSGNIDATGPQTTSNQTEDEHAVRRYLQWLADPASLRDEAAVAAAQHIIDGATDPIEKLKAVESRRRAEAVDGSELRDEFVNRARRWAATNDVSGDAFRELGVSVSDLRDAGFSVSNGGPRRSSGAGATGSGGRPRTSAADIEASIPDGRPFTISDIEAASGASNVTVRKVVAGMIEAGTVVDLGPDKQHEGRGRAPLLYRRAG